MFFPAVDARRRPDVRVPVREPQPVRGRAGRGHGLGRHQAGGREDAAGRVAPPEEHGQHQGTEPRCRMALDTVSFFLRRFSHSLSIIVF